MKSLLKVLAFLAVALVAFSYFKTKKEIEAEDDFSDAF